MLGMVDRPGGHVRIAAFMILALLSAPAALPAGAPEDAPQAVDGIFSDWNDVSPAWSDTLGDGHAVDLGRLWVRSDSERVTLRFETGSEMSLQGGNIVRLFIDGDADAGTGDPAEGIGAELSWTFGRRSGSVFTGGVEREVEQADVGFLQAPTVSSDEFEVSFLRRTRDGAKIVPGPIVEIVLADGHRATGDRLPDRAAVRVEISDDPPAPDRPVSLERNHPDDLRVLTWNVLFDGLFKRPGSFTRVLRALDPDVVCFQEIWAHSARQAADRVSLAIPGAAWYGAGIADGHVVSRYPFLDEAAIDEAGNYWALVDLPDDRYGVDLSVVSAHPPCCDNEEGRQGELDGIAAWLRDLTTPPDEDGGVRTARLLPHGTPLVVAGDMNLVGSSRQLRTLLEGEIADGATFGPSRAADWDGTPLLDAWPRTAGGAEVHTWRDSRSSFAPGKLDYIVFSDSVLRLENAFILDTETLDAEALSRYGLRRDDTLDASDHLPVVADFSPVSPQARTEAAE